MEQEALIRSGAANHRGSSKQDYATPREFIEAVQAQFGEITFDLAAHAGNAVCADHYDEAADSLSKDWSLLDGLWLWLNPPFGNIAPWAEKCAYESKRGARILFLTHAGVGTNWFIDHVLPNASVYALTPRLSFDGKNPFPKDCILSLFDGVSRGFQAWRWK